MKRSIIVRLTVFGLFLSFVALQGCKEDPPPPPEPPRTKKVVVINEGLPASGTGSVSLYDPLDKSIDNNVFFKANTYPPGNGLYSIYTDGDRSFLVVAGTGEILMVNTASMEVQKRFVGLGAPHRMLKISENKFYVTDWQENGVWILNVKSGSLIKSVLTGLAPESLVSFGNLVFVTNSGGAFADSTVSVIHAVEDTLMAQLPVGHNPNSLLIDDEDQLWVLCSGIEDIQTPFNSTPGVLVKYDLSKDSLEFYLADSLALDTFWVFQDNQLKPQDIVKGESNNIFYFLDYYKEANLMKFNRDVGMLPTGPFIAGSFNALGFDPIELEIYLSDPGDETSPGTLYRFGVGGGQIDARETGIKPVDIGFL